jgi:hypothetical protein
MLTASLQGVLTKLGDQLKRGLRRVTLTVSWPEGATEESFRVTTHMVVLAPAEQQPLGPQTRPSTQPQVPGQPLSGQTVPGQPAGTIPAPSVGGQLQ